MVPQERDQPRITCVALSLALAACLGCTGKIDDAAARTGAGTGAGAGPQTGTGSTTGGRGAGGMSGGDPSLVAGELNVPYTRLTRVEYQATVKAAFNITPDVGGIPNDSRVGPFTSNVGSPDPADEFLLASEDLAAQIVPAKLPTCTGATAATCVKTNYQAPIERLYRRSLTTAEVTTLGNMISPLEAAGVTSQDATRAMVLSTLLSADFLFRSAPLSGDAARGRRLTEHLGYALWDAPPDTTLVAAGNVTAAQLGASLKTQALRLGADARAVPVLARFLAQWLRVDTDDKLDDPNLNFATSPLYAELQAFVQNALTKNVPVTSFVNGTQGFIQKSNFAAYAMTPVTSTATVVPVTWSASSVRRGILGEEVFMDATRNPDPGRRPIFRGHLVRSSLLCQPIASPPPELIALNSEVTDRTTDTRCKACHSLMDPIGQAFAPNDLDNTIGMPAPVVNGGGEVTGTFKDLPTLMDAIAGSQAYADCFSRNLLAFFLEQDPDYVDAASVADVSAIVKSGGGLADAIAQAVVSLEKRSQSTTPWCTGQ